MSLSVLAASLRKLTPNGVARIAKAPRLSRLSRLTLIRALSSAAPPAQSDAETTHFGKQQVPKSEKSKLVGEVFHRVAERYDLMNDLMSAGVHRIWKEQFVCELNPLPGTKLLDVAGGTGDIAFRFIEAVRSVSPPQAFSFQRASSPRAGVVVCDINPSMLKVGKERARQLGYLHDGTEPTTDSPVDIEFVEGDAEKLPFPDNSFDAYTIAFGLRNVTQIDLALREARRVLKPGGRFLCLEFSQVVIPGLREFYDTYSFNVIPLLGQVIAQDRASYQYLVESIRNFPPQEDLAAMMTDAGFKSVTYSNLTGGIACIHSGFKL